MLPLDTAEQIKQWIHGELMNTWERRNEEMNKEMHRIQDDAGHYDEPWWLDMDDTGLYIVETPT